MAQDDIQGQVVDAQGNPVEGAIVEVTPARRDDSELEENVVRVSTNSNGEYRVWYHPQGDGTTQEWHVSCYNYDGTAYVNSFNNPGVTADLPSNVIPDSRELQSRYDVTALALSDGDPVSTWGDSSGNGFDLTQTTAADQPTYRTNQINGNPVVETDGSSENMDVAWPTESQPHTRFVAGKLVTNDTNNFQVITDGESTGIELATADSDNWRINAGVGANGGNADTNAHIFSILFSGSSSILRVDGTEVISADAGGNGSDGLTIGSARSQVLYTPFQFLEILEYPQDKSGIFGSVEQYLGDKYGITV